MSKSAGPIFEYRTGVSPSRFWLVVITTLGVATVIIYQGIGLPEIGLFSAINAIKHIGEFGLDPLSDVVYPRSYPPIFKPFINFYNIPAWHLFWGISVKILLVSLYFYLARILTGSLLATLFAVAMLFGVADFHAGEYDILNLRLPVGFATFEIREPVYLSFRQTAFVFGLLAVIFFVKKRYILSSVVLGIGAYAHPLNCVNFFINFAAVLLIYSLIGKDKVPFFRSMMKFSIPFVAILIPYLLMTGGMFPNVEPMNYSDFARFMMKNEPDDFSVVYFVKFFKVMFFLGFLLSLIAGGLHVVFLSQKPLTLHNMRAVIEQKDNILPLLAVPWIILLGGIIWETFLVQYLPGVVNDFLGHLYLRRVTSVSAIFYILIVSVFIANIVFVLIKLGAVEIFGTREIEYFKSLLIRSRLVSLDAALALVLALFLFSYTVSLSNKNLELFEKYLNYDHVSPEFFVPNLPYVYGSGLPLLSEKIPYLPFKEICLWIKENMPINAAFFHPTYIKEFRLLSERQGFVAEKVDGSMALYSRKFAAIYLKRFSDIHKGLDYDDLPGTVFEGGEAYKIMRKRYLSLSELDIRGLRQKYSGYNYFLTETSHHLEYPVLFENEYFRVYYIN